MRKKEIISIIEKKLNESNYHHKEARRKNIQVYVDYYQGRIDAFTYSLNKLK